MNRKKVGALLALIFGITTQLTSSGLILGDRTTTADGDSFSFNLLPNTAFDLTSEYFYVASNEVLAGDARQYAIAGTTVNAPFNTANGFVAFAPETVTLNGTGESANPLFGKKIGQIGIVGTQVVAVPENDQDAIYWIISKLSSPTQSMIGVTTFNDANAAASAGVVIYGDNSFGKTLVGFGSTLFAAIKPNGGGDFGDANGGIAVFTKTNNTTLTQDKAVWDSTDTKAVEIAVDTPALKLGANNLDGLTANGVDLHWDNTLQRLYIGVRVSDAGATGAFGVAVGYLQVQNQSGTNNKKLRLTKIVSSDAVNGAVDTELIVNPNDDGVLDIYRVRTMHTSTGLSYLIVESNVTNPGPVRNNLYALPLVDESANPNNTEAWKTSTTHGTLAKKDATPTDYYATAKNGIQHFVSRAFTIPATAAGDLPLSSEPAAKIGRGVAPGNISDIQVYKDTVFISTNAGTDPEKAGIFYSQALFDEDGKIVDWTAWQRVTYDDTSVPEAFAFAHNKGVIFTVEGTVNVPDTVKRTYWSSGANDALLGGTAADASLGFIERVSAQFSSDEGGIMGLFDFDKTNPAFDQDNDDNVSLMIATGYKKVVIVKTGTNETTTFTPTTGDFSTNQRTFTAGAISNTSTEGAGVTATTKIITVSGGDLDDLGAITSAAIVEDGTDGGYIAVGGTGGLALLRNTEDRTGWATTGLTKDFSDDDSFSTDKSFQKIGTYSNISKLWTATTTDEDAQALYILTDDTLYRIDAADLNDATPTATTLATLSGLGLPSYASFSDFVVSKTLGLLATSHGLYRTGDGNDISTEANEAAVEWVAVTLPDSFTGITKLLPIGKSALPYEFADDAAGQVYYIASTVSYQNAALGRLAITDASTAVAATTVQNVTHPVLKSGAGVVTDAPLTFLGNYRANFATNGATLLATSPQEVGQTTKLIRLPLKAGTGVPFSYQQEKEIDLGVEGNILGLTRNSATGSWLVYGDFGIKVLE
jgi:hypothetical protein